VVRGLMADGLTVPDVFAEPGCAAADPLVLEVQRTDPAPRHGRVPFELVVIDEPAVSTRSGLPGPAGSGPTHEPAVPTSGAQGRIAGGSAFADAASLRPGTWTDSLQPGEVLFYRVRADWGQTPAITFRLGPDAAAADRLGTDLVGVSVEAYGPARHRLYTRASGVNELLESRPQEVTARLVPVRYRNRETDNQMAGLSLAGDYYFSISMEETSGARFQVPMRISVALDGQPAGEPEYVAAPTPATSGPTPPTESGTASDPVSDEAEADGGSRAPVVAGVVTVAGVALIGAAVALRLRGRRDQPPTG
jgi:Ca-activated chloride channel family protein